MAFNIRSLILLLVVFISGCSNEPMRYSASCRDVDVKKMHVLHTEASGIDRIIDEELCEVAQQHSAEMSIIGLSHIWFKKRIAHVPHRSASENIAFGYKVEDTFAGFMNSRSHREAILSEKYDRVGYGTVRRQDGRRFWTIIFIESKLGPD